MAGDGRGTHAWSNGKGGCNFLLATCRAAQTTCSPSAKATCKPDTQQISRAKTESCFRGAFHRGHGEGGERLANGPSTLAKPTARVNFDLPPAEQPYQPVSPEKILPPSQATNNIFAARATAAPDFNLPTTERPTLLVPPAQRRRANQSLSKFLGPKQDPVSAMQSTGGCGRGGERLANSPPPHARPLARVNYDLPPAEWPHQPVSPVKILPPSQAPNNFIAARATAAPEMAPPPSFPSHRARAVQKRGAAEQADVHART
jgi:hypothetical protein